MDNEHRGQWGLALVAGKWLVGRRWTSAAEVPELRPVYEWKSNVMPNPRNPALLEVEYACVPIEGMLSFDSLELPAGSAFKPLDELSKLDRERVMATIREGEGIMDQLRRTQGGIIQGGLQLVPPGKH